MGTGLKVGGNYVKHYSKKLVNQNPERDDLDEQNAKDIYNTLKEMKGSALKAAQMLSLDRGMMPAAYARQFAQAQYQAPPLSGPLIVKTFKEYFGQRPQDLFDHFDMQSSHAASIGQVHQATKDGQKLAVKIQYPGVGDSVISDLNMVRPMARRLFGWKDQDLDAYFEEVKARLVEETDYTLELRRSMEISQQCAHLPHLAFASYYPKLSADRVITMSWQEGQHLDEFLATDPDQAVRDALGQALWDFYNYQLHHLKVMHADAHPGNFLFRPDGTVAVLDFGCAKEIPEDFYQNYIALLDPATMEHPEQLKASLIAARIIFPDDQAEEQQMYMDIAQEGMAMVLRPFHAGEFDFGDESYFDEIYAFADRMGRNPALRQSAVPRGDADGLYMSRTYFGLFSILNRLKARVQTTHYMPSWD